MRIPIPRMLRLWREREKKAGLSSWRVRAAYSLWALAAKRPALYRSMARLLVRALSLIGQDGKIRRLPLGAAWTATRDFPAPAGETFQALLARRKKS